MLIHLYLVGSQGMSEGIPTANERTDVKSANVRGIDRLTFVCSHGQVLTRDIGTCRRWIHANVPWGELGQPPADPQLSSNLNPVSFSAILFPLITIAWLTLWLRI